MKVAIGPARDFPSWHWCGGDLVPGLRSVHDVTVFRQYAELSNGSFDAVVVIKVPPSRMASAPSAGPLRIVYIPVDFFETEDQIARHAGFLESCSEIGRAHV